MKIIVLNPTNKIIFSVEENCQTNFLAEENMAPCLEIVNFDNTSFLIADITEENVQIIEGLTLPNDFVGGKYLYDDSESHPFVLNPDWIEPESSEESPEESPE